MKRERSDPDYFEREVLPALFERLDQAFPEFGWTRKGRGWTATNRSHTKSLPGEPRPDRVVCNEPFGFLVHGGDATSWTTYANGGTKPTGAAFWDVARKLAGLAGVDVAPLELQRTPEEEERFHKRERRRGLLEDFFAFTKAALHAETEEARQARAYLVEKRGFEEKDLEELPFGLCPPPESVKTYLEGRGYGRDELEASGLLKDSRWTGRLTIPWRDRWDHLATFAARDLTGKADEGQKYLYLAGATKPEAFGLDEALRTEEGRRNLVLVEGLVDVVSLHARGFPNVAALGGGGNLLTANRWERLSSYGVRAFTLVLDNDPAGREGTLAAVENASKGNNVPNVYVVDPEELEDCKDPDELVRRRGLKAFRSLLEQRVHAYRFKARSLVQKHKPGPAWTDAGLGEALDEAVRFDESVTAPEKLLDLDRFFWPEIVKETGADEDTLQARLVAAREKQARAKERSAYETLLRAASRTLGEEGLEAAKRELREGVDRLRVEERTYKAEPVLSVADELAEHGRRLEQWRGREYIGLVQKTLPKLDEATLGLRGLMLLAAAPNVGKTALAVQLGLDVVTWNEDACFLFLSLEMSRWDILSRIKCRLAEVDWKTLVFGSDRRTGQTVFSRDELRRLKEADEALADRGKRIRILDERNFPAPTVEKVLANLADLKARTGTNRAFVLVDYLQVWPIPDHEARTIRSELEADKWRVGAMKTIRDSTEGDAVLVISEARKPASSGGKSEWGGDLADVMGSARGSYTPDMVFLFQALTDEDLKKHFGNTDPETKRAKLEEAGKAYNRLRIAKGRDGVLRQTFDLTFWYRQARFEEDFH